MSAGVSRCCRCQQVSAGAAGGVTSVQYLQAVVIRTHVHTCKCCRYHLQLLQAAVGPYTSAYVSIRSGIAYVSIRPHTFWHCPTCRCCNCCRRSSCCKRGVACAVGIAAPRMLRQHTSAYVSIRQHTSAYVLALLRRVTHTHTRARRCLTASVFGLLY